jgi:lipoate synthase
MKVDRYVEPVEFNRWKQIAEDMGFLYVASGPLVRSSYKVGVDHSYARFSLIIIFPPGG